MGMSEDSTRRKRILFEFVLAGCFLLLTAAAALAWIPAPAAFAEGRSVTIMGQFLETGRSTPANESYAVIRTSDGSEVKCFNEDQSRKLNRGTGVVATGTVSAWVEGSGGSLERCSIGVIE